MSMIISLSLKACRLTARKTFGIGRLLSSGELYEIASKTGADPNVFLWQPLSG
jgi:hypothetical protein